MQSDNFTPTFLKTPSIYKPRPIFSSSMQPPTNTVFTYNVMPITASRTPPPVIIEEPLITTQPILTGQSFSSNLDYHKEINKLNLKIKLLEKEKSLEEKERVSLSELVNNLKAHIKGLEEQLKINIRSTLESSSIESDRGALARLHEQEELFKRKEQLFEEERNQLLKVLSAKDSLVCEIQEDRQKEYQFVVESLKQQLEEKQMSLEEEKRVTSELTEKVQRLQEDFDQEKSETYADFEAQKQFLEQKISKILEENEKVVIFNNGLLKEVENMRALNQGLEQKHTSHLEEIKMTYKSQIENNKSSLRSNFEIEKTSMENQILDLKAFNEKMKEKFEDILSENQNLRTEKETIVVESGNRVAEVEEKIIVLLERNQELLALVEADRIEIDDLKKEFKELQNENFEYVDKFKEESEKALYSQQALERKETQYQLEIEELKSNKLRLESSVQDLENKILDLLADNEKLNNALLDRIKENELMKISVTGNKLLNEKNDDLHQQLENYQGKIKYLEEKFEKLLSENGKLNTVFEKTHKDFETSKARVAILEKELEARMKIINDQNAVNRSTNYHNEKERESIMNSMESLEKTNNEMRVLIENLRDCKQKLESEVNQNRQDFSELEKDFQELKQEFNAANQRNELLSKENEKKDVEISVLIDKIDNIETNFTIQTQEIKLSYESAMQYLNAEIELHKKSLVVARNTIEDCHKSYLGMKENKKLAPLNEALEIQLRNLENQLNESHALLKEKMIEIEKYRMEIDQLRRENQDMKTNSLLNVESVEKMEEMQNEIAQYKLLLSENELLRNKNEDLEDKYQKLLNDFDNLGARAQFNDENLKKTTSKNIEHQEKLNDALRNNAQLTQINQENTSINEELRLQNERLKNEISDLLNANDKLNLKIKNLAYEHQDCFDTQRLEKDKIQQELDHKYRKILQEQDFKRKELENKIKTLELRFASEQEAFMREKKSIKQSFELELEQLSQFNNTLKSTLYEHESQINALKTENEALYNEKQRILADFDSQMMNFDRSEKNYRVALADLENQPPPLNFRPEINMGFRENEDMRQPFNENYVRFNGSNVLKGHMGGMMEFEKGRMGRTGPSFDRKTMDILKNNDRLNEQILRRCREIVGE